MRDLPTGTATFLFTDIEGSTSLLQRLGPGFTAVLELHNALLRGAIEPEGRVIRGEGDAFFAVFPSAVRAVAAAVAAQQALAGHPWPEGVALRVRMGLHTGEATLGGDDYVGLDVHRAARIAAAGHGGQVLLSEATRSLVLDALPEGARLRDLGEHRLKDLPRPERLYQLDVPGLPADFPPPRSLGALLANLPTQLTSFVGREAEVARATRLLATSRLLTLTGPGGTGKTRLSLQVAAEVADQFPDGVFFVPLAPIRDPDLVPSAILLALGVQESGARPPRERLADHLRDRQLLLVLDNFEQLLPAAPLVGELLQAAPGVRVLATSRAALHVYGEQELPVPPLRLPDPHALPRDLQALSQYEAVQLFIERAVAVKPDFTVTNDNAPAVAEICVRMDGLPLAIELAAARVKLLPPQALLSRLERRLGLPAGGARDLPERQQTLRGAIAWSHDLLDAGCQRLFARFAVFAGGATLADAEAVCGPPQDLGGMEVLDGLASLVDQSLLRQTDDGHGEPRFWMLETIREFAQEKLQALGGEAETLAERHAMTFLALAERAAPEVMGPDQKVWLDRLEREHDNLRAALAWAVAAASAEPAMRLVFALWRFWHMRGHILEGRQQVARVLALPACADQPPARMKALEAAGGLAYWHGDMAAAAGYYEEALALSRVVGGPADTANALYNLGFVWRGNLPPSLPELEQCRAYMEEALALYRALGDRAGVARVTWGLADLCLWMRDYQAGQPYAEAALAEFRTLGDPFGLAWALYLAGAIAVGLRDIERARQYCVEALQMLRDAHDVSGIGLALDGLADVAFAEGNRDRAARLAGAATAVINASGAGLATANRQTQIWGFAAELEALQALPAWAEGAAMSMDQAVAYALESMPAAPAGAGA